MNVNGTVQLLKACIMHYIALFKETDSYKHVSITLIKAAQIDLITLFKYHAKMCKVQGRIVTTEIT